MVNDKKLFIVCRDKQYFGYLNNCPHQHIPLDWENDQFLDYDEELIQCATHGALFVIETGICVAGPCMGASLTQIELDVIDETIYAIDL